MRSGRVLGSGAMKYQNKVKEGGMGRISLTYRLSSQTATPACLRQASGKLSRLNTSSLPDRPIRLRYALASGPTFPLARDRGVGLPLGCGLLVSGLVSPAESCSEEIISLLDLGRVVVGC